MKKYNLNKICCSLLLFLLFLFTAQRITVQAASLDLSEICQNFERAIGKGEKRITFQTSADYTLEQVMDQLAKAAENKNMLFTDVYTYQKQEEGEQVTYTISLTDNSLLKVRRLKNKEAAFRAALKALKNCDYKTKFYSKTSYYSEFMLMLQQHPEYNYNTLVWKNGNGTFGYRRSRELTKSEQNRRMKAAAKNAEAFIQNYLTPDMTSAQKLKAIHDYLINRCSYDYALKDVSGYEDSLTAYGALVKKKAVCQGYTAAFNLLAQKAGFYSMAVCGAVHTGDHAWNIVRIGNQYRHMDCTWDKTLQTGMDIRYDYFLIKKKLIAQNHTWNPKKFKAKYVEYCKYIE